MLISSSGIPMNSAFQGNPLTEHYPIWWHGLTAEYVPGNGPVIVQPRYMRELGKQIRHTMAHPDAQIKSEVEAFLSEMERIIQNERSREDAAIQFAIDKIKNIFINNNAPIPPTVQLAETAFNKGRFSEAYTWLMHYQENVDVLKKEVQHKNQYGNYYFNNISHMNYFWRNEFSTFLSNYFQSRINESNQIDFSTTDSPEEIVNQYIQTILGESEPELKDKIQGNIDLMNARFQGMYEDLGLSYSKKKITRTDFQTILKAAEVKKGVKHKATKASIEEVARFIGYEVGRGIGAEVAAVAQGAAVGHSQLTGLLKKSIVNKAGDKTSVAIKPDAITIMLDQAALDIPEIAAKMSDLMTSQNYEEYEQNSKLFDEVLQNNSMQAFQVLENVKGYQSKKALIIGSGTISQRTNELKLLMTNANLPQDTINRLLFLLNNTFEDCIADWAPDQKEYLKLYLGMVCAIWLFDDYEAIYVDTQAAQTSGLQRVRIFVSGGNYYTLSEILSNTCEKVREYLQDDEESTVKSLLTFGVSGFPKSRAQTAYQETVDSNQKAMNEAREAGDTDRVQELLKQRWDKMREVVMDTGKITLAFRQSQLEQLLNNFEAYLKS